MVLYTILFNNEKNYICISNRKDNNFFTYKVNNSKI